MTKEKDQVAHTPGPWYVEPFEDDCDGIGVCAFGKGVVADVDSDYCEPDEMQANAHLIAAAPELLSALKAVMEQFDAGYFQRNTDSDGLSDWAIRAMKPLKALGDAKAAIAKAEGK